jgi:hypothetical protein
MVAGEVRANDPFRGRFRGNRMATSAAGLYSLRRSGNRAPGLPSL